jgi:hypothetical protein
MARALQDRKIVAPQEDMSGDWIIEQASPKEEAPQNYEEPTSYKSDMSGDWVIEPETIKQKVTRVGAGAIRAGLQRGIQMPGDISRGIGALTDLRRGFTPEQYETLASYTGEPEKGKEWFQEQQKLLADRPTPFYEQLPTKKGASEFLDKTAQFFGIDPQYFKPRGKVEKFIQSSAKDFTSLLPALLFSPATLPGVIAESVIPNLVKTGLKEFGYSKKVQRLSKFGTQLLIGSFNLFKPEKESKLAYNVAQAELPKAARIPTPALHKELEGIKNRIRISRLEPKYKTIVNKSLDAFADVTHNRTFDAHRLIAQKNDLGTIIREPGTPKKAIGMLNDIRKAAVKDLMSYGKINTSFGNAFKQAERLQKDIHREIKAFKAVNDYISAKNIGIGSLASVILGAYSGDPYKYLQYTAGALALKGGAHVLNHLAKSPAMYKYYGKILTTALSRRPQQLGKLIKKFDEELTKEFGYLNK